jgi:hypothetical protein
MEPLRGDPVLYRAAPKAQLDELPVGDQALLPDGQLGQHCI